MASDARSRLIESAIALTSTRGIAGTTVADLLKDSGVARRSLYLNFPGGRDEVLAAATEQAGSAMTDGLAELTGGLDISTALDLYIAAMRTELEESDFTAACPIMAAGLGGAEVPAARTMAGATLSDWCRLVGEGLEHAGVAPDRARLLATVVVAGLEGARAIAVATRSTAPLDDLNAYLREQVVVELGG